MDPKAVSLQSLNFSDHITKTYLGDLSDADLLVRAIPGMQHIAWQLGHLISVERSTIEAIAPGSCPALPEGFDARHTKEAGASDDPAAFYTKAQYLEAWDKQRAATIAVLDRMSEEELDAAAPEQWRKMIPTAGLCFNFLGGHVLMHVGQYVAVRRLLNKPITI